MGQGATGPKGSQGIAGEVGEKGDKGDAGSPGLKGDTGSPGSKGDKGDTGSLSVASDLTLPQNVYIQNKNFLKFGQSMAGQQANAGEIGYKRFSDGLDIIGAGETTPRIVKVWDKLIVGGDAIADNVRTPGILELGSNQTKTGDTIHNGKIGYKSFSTGLDIIGVSDSGQQRLVKVWDKLLVDAVQTNNIYAPGFIGPYKLSFFNKAQCFDVGQMGGNGGNGCSDAGTNDWQRFMYNPITGQIRSNQNNMCLDSGNAVWNFVNCNNHQNQGFKMYGGTLMNVGTNQCLDLGNTNHKANCDLNNDNQRVHFVYDG